MSENDGSDLIAQYAEAMRPYTEMGGPIPAGAFLTRAWRYFVEINSGCNLRCVLCSCGNREGYEHVNAFMEMPLLEQILDKIQSENPGAIVMPYGNSEPFLHPKLPECLAAIKKRGLRCEMATNLNHINRLQEVLDSGVDSLFISVSGFTQEVYGRSHVGGHIETVKENMRILAGSLQLAGPKPHVMVHYHMYKDTIGPEFDQMKAFAESLGFQFIYSWARAIAMETTIQYLHWLEEQRTGTVREFAKTDAKDWNKLFPPVSPAFIENVKRLSISPAKAVEMYARYPVQAVCPVGDIFCFIRHDGLASLCACVSDRRLNLGPFLKTTQEQMSSARRGHPVCQECLHYRLNLYYHVVDGSQFNL